MVKRDEVLRLVRTRLLGESVREFGVLTLIFPVLDILLEYRGSIVWPTYCLWHLCVSGRNIVLVFFVILGIFAVYYGIKIESAAELTLQDIQRGGQNDIPDATH